MAGGGDFATCVENIDIGGPAMIRSAAKNHAYVAVCTDAGGPGRGAGGAEGGRRDDAWPCARRLAARAFARTAAYDAAISAWFARPGRRGLAPARKAIAGRADPDHALWREPAPGGAPSTASPAPAPGVATARQLQGKELSYNNIADTDAAFELVAEFDPAQPAPPWPSSSTPIPAASPWAPDLKSAYARALQCDPVSAFGGIVAVNRRLDAAAAARDRQDLHRGGDRPRAPTTEAIAVFARTQGPAPAAHRRPARPDGARARPSARWPAASSSSPATTPGSPPPT